MANGFHAFMGGDGVTTGEVHWGAVFAGVIVALVGQLLFTLLGAGLGAATFDDSSADTIALGAFAWWLVSGIAAGFAGGWAAGWVSGSAPSVDRIEGAWQAFLSWALAALIAASLVLTMASSSTLIARMAGPLSYSVTRTVERAAAGSEADQAVVADVTQKGALTSFFALIIGAVVAMGGGYLGVQSAKRAIAASPGVATTSAAMRRAEA